MKNLQNNNLKIDWSMVDATTKNVYLCPEILKEMNDEALLTEEELKPYTKEELLEMAETGRRQITEGNYFTTEEVMQNCGYEIPKGKAV